MRYENVSTHDLKVGDRIALYGMVLLIDREPHETNHPVNKWSPTLATPALVENWEEMVERAKDDPYIAGFVVGCIRADMAPNGLRARNALKPHTEPRWTIQGNGLARWSRIVP